MLFFADSGRFVADDAIQRPVLFKTHLDGGHRFPPLPRNALDLLIDSSRAA